MKLRGLGRSATAVCVSCSNLPQPDDCPFCGRPADPAMRLALSHWHAEVLTPLLEAAARGEDVRAHAKDVLDQLRSRMSFAPPASAPASRLGRTRRSD